LEATLLKTINIPEFTSAELDWPIIRIPAKNLHLSLKNPAQDFEDWVYDLNENWVYELKPAAVKFSPAVIQTEGRNYSFAQEQIVCYQYRTDTACHFTKFSTFCQSDPELKQVESGFDVSPNSDGNRGWVVLVSAAGFGDVLEPKIFQWATNLEAKFFDKETDQPVNVNIIKHKSRIR
jgi:hypothetical protein